uniref:Integrase catalytic domain-containing protein n=1 Tax=Nicotiana tabacum TaxID=4097 RepID=A0A1S3Z672_TOBAC|nr:PREDICTED: uncharacterized protein LOC107783399 [Nicotiana tabacum]
MHPRNQDGGRHEHQVAFSHRGFGSIDTSSSRRVDYKNVKILPYMHCVMELCNKFTKIEFRHIPMFRNEFADTLATLSSMIQHPYKNYIDPIEIETGDQHAYCFHVDEEPDTINYFTKWVKASTNKAIIKKVLADFVRNNIVCRFGIPESIIINNAVNLNGDLMREICNKFRIVHHNSTTYRLQMNGAVEAANKNIKRILRKIMDNHRQWHEKLYFALLGYWTTMRTSTGSTPYMLVYGTEVVIPAEVEIPSLKVIQEAKLDDAE